MADGFRIPFQEAESEFVEKRSRFISHVWRVETEEEAQARIQETKKKYYDARHNCWCYLLGPNLVRYSDDGEPQGTAGQPMLNVFQRENVTGAVCVVTRYFGGILLGWADIEIVLKTAHLKFHFALLGFDGFRFVGGRGCGSLFFLLLYAGDGGFASLRFDRVKAEVVKNALYLRGVIREHHHFDAVRLLLVPNGNIQKTVGFGFRGELLHVFRGDVKEFERALFPEHPHKPCLAVGFLLVLQYGIDKQRKVFCRHARQLESHFRALKGKSNDLVGWIASVVQSIHLPFIAPSHRSVCVLFFPARLL